MTTDGSDWRESGSAGIGREPVGVGVQVSVRVTEEQREALRGASRESGLPMQVILGGWLQALCDRQRGIPPTVSVPAASTDPVFRTSEFTHDEQCQCPGGCWGATSDDGGI